MVRVLKLPLHGKRGKGLVALVDASLRARVIGYRWVAATKRSGVYAVTWLPGGNGSWRPLYLHQIVMPDAPAHVDHRNGNTLDCRKSNLRLASTKENIRSAHKWRRRTSSQYKGVLLDRRERPLSKPWRAAIMVDRRTVRLGYFPDEVSAAHAYDVAARKFFGEFARVNFPEKGEVGCHG